MREILELAQVGGINLGLLIGIIGILGLIRKFDKKSVLAGGFYLTAVIVLGIVSGLITSEGGIGDRIMAGIAHGGTASILYQYWDRLRPGNNTPKSSEFKFIQKE